MLFAKITQWYQIVDIGVSELVSNMVRLQMIHFSKKTASAEYILYELVKW